MQVLVLAMYTLSLIHEGTILQRGGGLDDAKVIKVSKQVNVKSGSNLDSFPCQEIMSLIRIQPPCTSEHKPDAAWHAHSYRVEKSLNKGTH